LQAKYSALNAGLILGVIWTCWHLPLFFLTGETQVGIPFPFYLALVVTLSVYLTWLYNNTGGSLVITTLAHWSFNLTGVLITGPVFLMPANIFYMTASPLLLAMTVWAAVRFGPKHLSRLPEAELPKAE
jgi:membrane protease YdiL (CAAX protease family)